MLPIVTGVANCVVVQFRDDVVSGGGAWANAAGEASKRPARPAPANKPGPRMDVKKTLIHRPQTKNRKQKNVSEKTR
jgi:hypothetical protein